MKNWFDHDYNARNDERLLEIRAEFGAEGYGIFWMILESLAENGGYLNRSRIGGLSLAYGVVKATLEATLEACLKQGLFLDDKDGNFWSERMNDHLSKVKALSDAGKRGAEARQKNRLNNANLSGDQATLKPPLSHPSTLPSTEENRIEENRREIPLLTKSVRAESWADRGYDIPESLEVLTTHAEMKGFTAAVAQRYWDKRRSTGWTKPSGNQQIPIKDWRSDFNSIAHYLKSDVEKDLSSTIVRQNQNLPGKNVRQEVDSEAIRKKVEAAYNSDIDIWGNKTITENETKQLN